MSEYLNLKVKSKKFKNIKKNAIESYINNIF